MNNCFFNNKYVSYLFSGLAYIAIAIIYFHPFFHNFNQTILTFTPGGDQETFVWFLYWWPFAISHGLNPFITHYVWAPSGFNLTWATSIPTLSLISTPLTLAFGPIFSWNLLSLLAPPLNAISAFVLLRHIYKSDIAAFLGGYIFGYSSYVLSQELGGHLNLDFVSLIPLAILLFIMSVERSIKIYRFVMIMAFVLFLQAGISTEVLATSTLFGFISIFSFFLFRKDLRNNLTASALYLLLSYIIAAMLLSPFLYFLIIGFSGVPKLINSPIIFSSDILNYIIPTPITRIFGIICYSITSRFTGNYYEDGAYIGIPLFLLASFAIKEYIDNKKATGNAILLIFLIIIIFSFGQFLHINGITTNIVMPWSFFMHIPLIRGALPSRFTDYASLLVAIIIASWITTGKATRERYIVSFVAILFIIPNTNIYDLHNQYVPKIFTGNSILNKKNVVILPFGSSGPSMFWQMESGMKFKMVGGYVGFTPLPFRKIAVTSELSAGVTQKNFTDLFKSYCAQFNVQYVVLCPGTPDSLEAAIMTEGWVATKKGQCTAYLVPQRTNHQ